ncbi:NAD(P)/FAD-dependent oxidoreductase [Nocardia sp. NPDC050710]|uniref:NAD(P)/FAD-dependent oxidoreductase n=1 Tax=Nocardia sp. NPDC050710 TaxID=3157220 RepID=UPI0033FB02A2
MNSDLLQAPGAQLEPKTNGRPLPSRPAAGRYDAVVVGGGLAGSAVAIGLARSGARVALLEKEARTFGKVCGEFLSREALTYLDRLGVDPDGLGGVPMDGVRLRSRQHNVDVRLPFRALGLSRHVLDEELIGRAAQEGVDVHRGIRARKLTGEVGRWRVETDKQDFDGREIFLATGKHDLRGWTRECGKGVQSGLAGFKQHWKLTPAQSGALGNHVELVFVPGGYCGINPVEGGETNVCLLLDKAQAGPGWDRDFGSIDPAIAERLVGADPVHPKMHAVSSIPYGYIARTSDGVWRLGDQGAVIPSFAGDGMSIALHSASLAVAAWQRGYDADRYQARLARDVRYRIRQATWLSQALVSPRYQSKLLAIAESAPWVVSGIARMTRLPNPAMKRAVAPTDGRGANW